VKIIQHTPTRLTLREYPLELWLNGGMLVFLSLVLILFSAEVTTFTCQRLGPTQGQCELATASLLNPARRVIELHELHGARLESPGPHGSGQVVLLTTGGDVPLTRYQGLSGSKSQAVDQINAFVSDPTAPALTVREDGWRLAFVIGLSAIGFVAALVILVKARIATCTFDKALGKVTLRRRGLLGAQVRAFALRDIVDVQVEKHPLMSAGTRAKPRWVYRINLIIGPDEHVPLVPYRSSGSKAKRQSVACICAFLDLKSYWLESTTDDAD